MDNSKVREFVHKNRRELAIILTLVKETYWPTPYDLDDNIFLKSIAVELFETDPVYRRAVVEPYRFVRDAVFKGDMSKAQSTIIADVMYVYTKHQISSLAKPFYIEAKLKEKES